MKRLWPLLLLACGQNEDAVFQVSAEALSIADVAQLQVSMVTQRSTVDCSAVTMGCVKDQFPITRFVDLQDASGATHKGVRFSRDAGLEIHMAPARDLALVIEALTGAPQLAGSSCTYVPEITGGLNHITASPLVIHADAGVVSTCNPTLD